MYLTYPPRRTCRREGETAVTGVEHIQRGYEDLTGELAQLGADIRQEER